MHRKEKKLYDQVNYILRISKQYDYTRLQHMILHVKIILN